MIKLFVRYVYILYKDHIVDYSDSQVVQEIIHFKSALFPPVNCLVELVYLCMNSWTSPEIFKMQYEKVSFT